MKMECETEREMMGLVGCKWGEMTDDVEIVEIEGGGGCMCRGWIIEARDLTEEKGMRMGWLLSWKCVAVETGLIFFFPDRPTVL